MMTTSSGKDRPVCFSSGSESETHAFGKLLSKFVFPGLLILLSGELGTGKTVLIRGLVEGLSGGPVRSPSFTLVNEYDAVIPVTHADLYRISACRFGDVGLEEALEEKRLVLVEWAEHWQDPPEVETWHCLLETRNRHETGTTRLIRIHAHGAEAVSSLEKLREALDVLGGWKP